MIAPQYFQQLRGGNKQGSQARIGAEGITTCQQRRGDRVHQRHHMVDGMDNRLAQAFAISREQPQPRVDAVHGTLDGRLDQRLGVLTATFFTAEKRLEQFQHVVRGF